MSFDSATEPSLLSDDLDHRANTAFGGRVVRKDLVRRVKVGANVPVYVLEYLLGKYCASDDPHAIEVGLKVVQETLTDNFIRPDEAQLAQANLKRRGKHRIIDKVQVRLVSSEDKYWAELANFGDRYLHIPEDIVYRYERLLQGGVWAQTDLVYSADDDQPKKRPFFIQSLRPIQVAEFSLDDYRDGRRSLSTNDWIDLLIRSIGMEPTFFDQRTKLMLLVRFIPMAERNYNLIELGPRGTGKSFVYREISPNAILISGGKTTVPQLFVNLSSGRMGLIGSWDTVAFDEVAGIEFSDTTVIQMLKDYMESGSFARGKEELPAEASLVFLGNLDLPAEELVKASHLFAGLPKAMIDPAFLDRVHFFIPGWQVPKMETRFFTTHYGFVSDYLSEAFRELRKQNFSDAFGAEFSLGAHLNARDEKAVRKTVAGLLKIIHPHGEWTRADLRDYLELALEGRRRVKEQLKKLAPHEYSQVDFSYIEKDTSRELWVEVPEQPRDALAELAIEANSGEHLQPSEHLKRPLGDLIEAGESATVEFKSSARWNYMAKMADKAIELEVIKTVAGFLNTRGGILLIGVADDGQVLGLDQDYKATQRADRDGYENWLTSIVEASMGKPPAALIDLSFEQVEGADVCRVQVAASPHPVYVEVKDDLWFYARLGNSTRRLNSREVVDYVAQHWRR